MHPVRKQRLYIVIFIVAGASIAAALAFWALQDNMNFFYAPTQIERGEAPLGKTIRVGGLVVPGRLKRSELGLEGTFSAVSSTHLTLPTSGLGVLLVGAGSLKKKKKRKRM